MEAWAWPAAQAKSAVRIRPAARTGTLAWVRMTARAWPAGQAATAGWLRKVIWNGKPALHGTLLGDPALIGKPAGTSPVVSTHTASSGASRRSPVRRLPRAPPERAAPTAPTGPR